MVSQVFKIKVVSILVLVLTISCTNKPTHSFKKVTKVISKLTNNRKGKSLIELNLIKQGLVDIQAVDSSITIDLRYSTANNFVGIDLYGDLDKVYLQKDVSLKLKKAQELIKEVNPGLSLFVFDGVRPLHIQQLMWDTLKIPFTEKIKFLSNPKNHSLHNYGAAVDLSIIDENRNELDMGTPYDFIGAKAYPRKEQQFLNEGILTQQQVSNRLLLRNSMKEAGFMPITTEWWHFNSCYRAEAKVKYKLVD